MRLASKISRTIIEVFMIVRFPRHYNNDVLIHPLSYIGKCTSIGRGTNINGKCFIGSSEKGKVVIGNYCAIAHGLRIRTRNHDMNYANMQDKLQQRYKFKKLDSYKGDVYIGNSCWIGDRVTILPGVTIGNGAVIGACSVVTKNVPPYAIVVGNPAKIIRYRFSDIIIEHLEDIKWWTWPESKIKENQALFSTNLNELDSTLDIRDVVK